MKARNAEKCEFALAYYYVVYIDERTKAVDLSIEHSLCLEMIIFV